MVISPLKAQLLERLGQAFNELDTGKRAPQTEEEKLSSLYAVVNVNQLPQKKKFGQNILAVLTVQNASILYLAVNRR